MGCGSAGVFLFFGASAPEDVHYTVTVKTAPPVGLFEAVTLPPFCSTIDWTT